MFNHFNIKNLFFSQDTQKVFQSMRHNKLLLLSILPFLFAVSVWWIFFTISITNFTWFINQFPNFWIDYSLQQGLFSQISYIFLLTFAIISMLLYGVIVAGACMLFAGFLTAPLVTKFIHTTYYPHIQLNPSPLLESCKYSSWLFAKTFTQFLFLSLCCYSLTFIGLGFIGLLLHIFVYFRFFSQNINHEVALNIMTKEEYEFFLQQNKIPLFLLNILVFLPLYIPILNLFVLTWQITLLTHFMMSWYAQYSTNTNHDYIEDAEIIEYK